MKKSVSTIEEVSGRSSIPLFYVVNYSNGGFSIISADKRIQPVMAYSKYNEFPIESKLSLPPGLVDWLEDYASMIKHVRQNDIKASNRTRLMWEKILDQTFNIDFLELLICEDGTLDFGEYVERKVLLETQWGQGCGYNAALVDSCVFSCNRPPVGCVATAIAQILKYHADGSWSGAYMTGNTGGNQGEPTVLDWANMPLTGITSSNYGEIHYLMRDLGTFLNMGYGCNGSGASYNNAFNTITNEMNFDGTQKNLNSISDYSVVISDIKNNRPVYMRGNEQRTTVNLEGEIEESYPGHGWVADGYAQYHDCRVGFRENDYQIHMNWGWNSSHDGYYMKKEGSFDENRQIIHNIKP